MNVSVPVHSSDIISDLMSVEWVDDGEGEYEDVRDNTKNIKHTEKADQTQKRVLQIKLLKPGYCQRG